MRAVRIDLATREVANIEIVDPKALPDIDGCSYLTETEWAKGENPDIGAIWSGRMPATFTPALPDEEPVVTPTAALEQAAAALEQAMQAVQAAMGNA